MTKEAHEKANPPTPRVSRILGDGVKRQESTIRTWLRPFGKPSAAIRRFHPPDWLSHRADYRIAPTPIMVRWARAYGSTGFRLGEAMPYFVKRTSQTGVPLPHPVVYARPSTAMIYACAAAGSGINDIWIEDEDGNCIADRAKIERIRRERASNLWDWRIYG